MKFRFRDFSEVYGFGWPAVCSFTQLKAPLLAYMYHQMGELELTNIRKTSKRSRKVAKALKNSQKNLKKS